MGLFWDLSFFSLYILALGQIIQIIEVANHNYADDVQMYISLTPVESLCHCIEQISDSMQQHFLQLNNKMSEVIVFGAQNE